MDVMEQARNFLEGRETPVNEAVNYKSIMPDMNDSNFQAENGQGPLAYLYSTLMALEELIDKRHMKDAYGPELKKLGSKLTDLSDAFAHLHNEVYDVDDMSDDN